MHLQWRNLLTGCLSLKGACETSGDRRYLQPPVVGNSFSGALCFLRLQCGYETGEDRLYLRLPVEVTHKITDGELFAGSGWLVCRACWDCAA